MQAARAARVLPLAGLLAGCQGELSALAPAGPAAQDVARAWWLMLGGAVLILIAVCALAVHAVWRKSDPLSEPAGRRLILWAGVAFPLTVLAALLAYGLAMGHGLLPGATAGDAYRVQVSARQWQWDVTYQQGADASASEAASDASSSSREPRGSVDVLHIPAGRPVDIAVTSADVIHGFWVPRLGGKIDAIPGRVNTVRLQADEPGEYHGVCAEFCGRDHTQMRFRVVAHEAEAFDAQLRQLGPAARVHAEGAAARADPRTGEPAAGGPDAEDPLRDTPTPSATAQEGR